MSAAAKRNSTDQARDKHHKALVASDRKGFQDGHHNALVAATMWLNERGHHALALRMFRDIDKERVQPMSEEELTKLFFAPLAQL